MPTLRARREEETQDPRLDLAIFDHQELRHFQGREADDAPLASRLCGQQEAPRVIAKARRSPLC